MLHLKQFSFPPFLLCHPDPFCFHFPSEKEQVSKWQWQNMTKQGTIIQGKKPHIEAWQENLIGWKVSQEMARVRDIPIVKESHKNTKLNNHHMYAEELVQTRVGFIIAILVSLSPGEACLVNLVGRILLVFYITSDSYNLSTLPPSQHSLSSLGRDQMETSNLDSLCSNVWWWVTGSVPISFWRNILWWRLNKGPNYE